jgi:hypothetical protein
MQKLLELIHSGRQENWPERSREAFAELYPERTLTSRIIFFSVARCPVGFYQKERQAKHDRAVSHSQFFGHFFVYVA